MPLPQTFPGLWNAQQTRRVYDALDPTTRFAATCELTRLMAVHCGGADTAFIAELAEALATNPATWSGYGHPVRSLTQRLCLRRRLEELITAAVRRDQAQHAPGWDCLQRLLAAPGRPGLFAHRVTGYLGADAVHQAVRRSELHPFTTAFTLNTEQSHLVQVLLANGLRLPAAIDAARHL